MNLMNIKYESLLSSSLFDLMIYVFYKDLYWTTVSSRQYDKDNHYECSNSSNLRWKLDEDGMECQNCDERTWTTHHNHTNSIKTKS